MSDPAVSETIPLDIADSPCAAAPGVASDAGRKIAYQVERFVRKEIIPYERDPRASDGRLSSAFMIVAESK
jgi:hypothetical protein